MYFMRHFCEEDLNLLPGLFYFWEISIFTMPSGGRNVLHLPRLFGRGNKSDWPSYSLFWQSPLSSLLDTAIKEGERNICCINCRLGRMGRNRRKSFLSPPSIMASLAAIILWFHFLLAQCLSGRSGLTVSTWLLPNYPPRPTERQRDRPGTTGWRDHFVFHLSSNFLRDSDSQHGQGDEVVSQKKSANLFAKVTPGGCTTFT